MHCIPVRTQILKLQSVWSAQKIDALRAIAQNGWITFPIQIGTDREIWGWELIELGLLMGLGVSRELVQLLMLRISFTLSTDDKSTSPVATEEKTLAVISSDSWNAAWALFESKGETPTLSSATLTIIPPKAAVGRTGQQL